MARRKSLRIRRIRRSKFQSAKEGDGSCCIPVADDADVPSCDKRLLGAAVSFSVVAQSTVAEIVVSTVVGFAHKQRCPSQHSEL